MKNNIFRNCFDKAKGNCVFASKNEYGTPCCTIDRIVQIEFYGCVPQKIINKKNEQYESEV